MTIYTFEVPAQGTHPELVTDDYEKTKDSIRLRILYFLSNLVKRSGEDFVRISDSGTIMGTLVSFLNSVPAEWTTTARAIKSSLFERVLFFNSLHV